MRVLEDRAPSMESDKLNVARIEVRFVQVPGCLPVNTLN